MTTDHLPCLTLIDAVTDYLEGVLDGPERRAIEDHLAECPDCSAALSQFRRTIDLAGRLVDDDIASLDERTRAQLVAAFREGRSSARALRGRGGTG